MNNKLCIQCGKLVKDFEFIPINVNANIGTFYFHEECRYGKNSLNDTTYEYLTLIKKLNIIKEEIAKYEKILLERLERFKDELNEN